MTGLRKAALYTLTAVLAAGVLSYLTVCSFARSVE